MKTDKLLSLLLIGAVGVICCISIMTVYATNPSWLPAHLAVISLGMGCATLITWIGWETLVASAGAIGSFVVALICLSGLFVLSPHESSNFFNMVCIPVYILIMCWIRRNNGGICLSICATVFCLALQVFSLHTDEIKLLMIMSLILIPCSLNGKRTSAYIFVTCCVIFLALRFCIIGGTWPGHSEWWRIGYYKNVLLATPWFGHYTGNESFLPLGGVWEDCVIQAAYVAGKWVFSVVVSAVILMTVISIIAIYRRSDSRRVLIFGCSIALFMPMISCCLRPFTPFILGFHDFPFMTPGLGMLVSFVILGIMLTALNDSWRRENRIALPSRVAFICSILLIGLGALSVEISLLHDYDSESVQKARMMPAIAIGHTYKIDDGIKTDGGAVWLPYCLSNKFVVGIHKCKNRVVLCRKYLASETPIIKAKCRMLSDGRIAVDCRDKLGLEKTMIITNCYDEVGYERK